MQTEVQIPKCPICLEDMHGAMVATCGHSVCSGCCIQLRNKAVNNHEALVCPICLQRVSYHRNYALIDAMGNEKASPAPNDDPEPNFMALPPNFNLGSAVNILQQNAAAMGLGAAPGGLFSKMMQVINAEKLQQVCMDLGVPPPDATAAMETMQEIANTMDGMMAAQNSEKPAALKI
jgi:hypothetical protein